MLKLNYFLINKGIENIFYDIIKSKNITSKVFAYIYRAQIMLDSFFAHKFFQEIFIFMLFGTVLAGIKILMLIELLTEITIKKGQTMPRQCFYGG